MRDAFNRHQILHARILHPFHTAKALQQPRPPTRTYPRNVFQPAAPGAHTRTRCPHAGDGKAVRLVANLRHQHQRRRVVPQIHLLAPIGKHQLFQPHLAAFALFHAHDA